MAAATKRPPEGVTPRHTRSCASRHAAGCAKRDGETCDCGAGACNCGPSGWQPWVSRKGSKHYGPIFKRLDEAKAWRHDAKAAMGKGAPPAPRRKTVDETADELLAGIEAGTVRGRGGRPTSRPRSRATGRRSSATSGPPSEPPGSPT